MDSNINNNISSCIKFINYQNSYDQAGLGIRSNFFIDINGNTLNVSNIGFLYIHEEMNNDSEVYNCTLKKIGDAYLYHGWYPLVYFRPIKSKYYIDKFIIKKDGVKLKYSTHYGSIK